MMGGSLAGDIGIVEEYDGSIKCGGEDCLLCIQGCHVFPPRLGKNRLSAHLMFIVVT